jgi:hypothetical protein
MEPLQTLEHHNHELEIEIYLLLLKSVAKVAFEWNRLGIRAPINTKLVWAIGHIRCPGLDSKSCLFSIKYSSTLCRS